MRHFTDDAVLGTENLNLLNSVSIGTVLQQKLQQVFQVQSFSLDRGQNRFALSIIRCSKSAHKFAVQVWQVATVVMVTTQLLLSKLKKLLTIVH